MAAPVSGGEDGSWVDVGAVDDFPLRRPRLVEVDGVEVGVYNLGRDEFRAIRNHCPHRGAPIGAAGVIMSTCIPSAEGEFHVGLSGRVVRCPWHHWEFDIDTGEALFGVSRSKIRVYRARTDRGRVLVSLDRTPIA